VKFIVSKYFSDLHILERQHIGEITQAKLCYFFLVNKGLLQGWICYGDLFMEMTVIHGRTELIAYYQRKGYALTGERRPFPMDDERFGLPKRELEFVVLTKTL
jgi:hypothetical protein